MTIHGLPVVKRESDASMAFDVDADEVVEYAPGVYWNVRSKQNDTDYRKYREDRSDFRP